jgi:hypothetical protein
MFSTVGSAVVAVALIGVYEIGFLCWERGTFMNAGLLMSK